MSYPAQRLAPHRLHQDRLRLPRSGSVRVKAPNSTSTFVNRRRSCSPGRVLAKHVSSKRRSITCGFQASAGKGKNQDPQETQLFRSGHFPSVPIISLLRSGIIFSYISNVHISGKAASSDLTSNAWIRTRFPHRMPSALQIRRNSWCCDDYHGIRSRTGWMWKILSESMH